MISNITETKVGKCINLTNQIDNEYRYTVIYSGFVNYPFLVIITSAYEEFEVSKRAMNKKQLRKYLGVDESYPMEKFDEVVPDKIK